MSTGSEKGLDFALALLRVIAVPFIFVGGLLILILSFIGLGLVEIEYVWWYMGFFVFAILSYSIGRAIFLFASSVESKRGFNLEVSYLKKDGKTLAKECSFLAAFCLIVGGSLNALATISQRGFVVPVLSICMLVVGICLCRLVVFLSK